MAPHVLREVSGSGGQGACRERAEGMDWRAEGRQRRVWSYAEGDG